MMEEKMMLFPHDHFPRRQKKRRRRFPWAAVTTLLLMVTMIGFVQEWGSKVATDSGLLMTSAPNTETPQTQDSVQIYVLEDNEWVWANNQSPIPDNRGDTQSEYNDTDWNLILVNNQNAIPENYEVNLSDVVGGEKVDERIYLPLLEMLEAAKEENLDQLPQVVSGYRTQEQQQRLYDEKIAKYRSQGYSEIEAKELAEQWVAVPGYSEHQVGLAVDINGATYDVYSWLQENSYKYGFIFRYPGGKTGITGVAEEVWHYRYVGVEAATEMHESGLCLEEFLGKAER